MGNLNNTSDQKKTILVTGGAGFIGAHLCRTLLERGNRVICLDNFRTGRMSHISDLLAVPDFSLVEADVTEPFYCEAEEIYHLACPASPVHYREDPLFTARTCFLGALHALELAERNHAAVLLTSTSEVYGEPQVHPQTEQYFGNVNPVGWRSCYDEGKRISETLFFDYFRTRGLPVRVVRIFNTYGPFMEADDGRVISNFISQALQDKEITIYGDGSQTRSFCYVSDTVEGLIRVMEQPGGRMQGDRSSMGGCRREASGAGDPDDAGCAGDAYVGAQEQNAVPAWAGPVNLGNPDERTVLAVAEEILRQTGSSSELVFRKLPENDPVRRRPDITRAEALIGWRPQVSFEEGVAKTIAWFRDTAGQSENPGV